jgi:hypothetical protein
MCTAVLQHLACDHTEVATQSLELELLCYVWLLFSSTETELHCSLFSESGGR